LSSAVIIAPAWSRATSEPTKPPALAAAAIVGDRRVVQRRRRDGAGDQRVGAKTFLGDLVDERVRRPQRGDAAARDVRQEHHRLRHVVQPRQPRARPDRALARAHDHRQPVRADQVGAVGAERLHVLVADRHLLLEAGVHAQLGREAGHQQRQQQQRREDGAPVREQDRLQAGDGAPARQRRRGWRRRWRCGVVHRCGRRRDGASEVA
jgi:hypothetical protein